MRAHAVLVRTSSALSHFVFERVSAAVAAVAAVAAFVVSEEFLPSCFLFEGLLCSTLQIFFAARVHTLMC